MKGSNMLELKVFSAPKGAVCFLAAIDYVASRRRRDHKDCSTLPSISGTMGTDDDVTFLSLKKKSEMRRCILANIFSHFFLLPPFFSITCELHTDFF
mmetsp:Transcript_2848/g.3240  ORF Transcript_2848/g.3240 Transcript_2848/m.3240 type:complete len:97 (+) Transcript_2848:608-898(+)